MTAGSVRGKCSLPSAGQRRDQPAALNCVVGPAARAAQVRAQPVVEGHGRHHEAGVAGAQRGADLAQVRPALGLARRRVLGEVGDVVVVDTEQGEVDVRGDVVAGRKASATASGPSDVTRAAPSHTCSTRERGSARRRGEPVGVGAVLGRAIDDPAREHEVVQQVPVRVHVRRA